MSNYLQLVQRLRQECVEQGSNSSVVGAVGEWRRYADWIAQAWVDIQEHREDWQWMRKTVTFNTIAQQQTYTPAGINIADIAEWRNESFRAYLTSAGVNNETQLGYQAYSSFRDLYQIGSRRNAFARPTVITVAPDKSLMLGLTPNDIYTVVGEYYKKPVIFSLDADIPDFDSRWHLLIVYKAMMSYGAQPKDMETTTLKKCELVYTRGAKLYADMLRKLETSMLPDIELNGALV